MASGPHGMGDADWDGGRVKEVPSSKVRPIDDYSMSSINVTVTEWERPTVDTIDVISSMAFLMRGLKETSPRSYTSQSMTPKLSPRSSSGR